MDNLASSALALLLSLCLLTPVTADSFVITRPTFKKINPGLLLPAPSRLPKTKVCPDIGVTAQQSRIANGKTLVTIKVVNGSSADYVSGAGQQALVISRNGRSQHVPFSTVRRGKQVVWRETLSAIQHPVTYSAAISFDPDIFVDGNPHNDDCRRSNNRAVLTTAR